MARVSTAPPTTNTPSPTAGSSDKVDPTVLATARAHLLGAPMPSWWRTWLGPVLAAGLAAGLRLPRLSDPHQLVFDETYYVKQAYTLWRERYERRWPDDSDEKFTAGTPDVYLPTGDFPVHPPGGKWMIAFGQMPFGIDSSFGWRFSAAICGILMVLILAYTVTRIFRSETVGTIAGVLLAVENHHIVHSRTSLLDIFIAFWGLAAFAALVVDRDHGRAQLARALALGRGPNAILWWRPWRIVAAIALAMAIGTKWSGMYFLAAFGIMTVLWDYSARRAAGSSRPLLTGFLRDGVIAFITIVPLALGLYVATWWGWIQSDDAHLRTWGTENPNPDNPLPDWFRSLVKYHHDAWDFHVNLSSEHTYQANPWAWVAQWRPTSFFYESPEPAQEVCGAESCSHAILNIGNVAIWWVGGVAIVIAAIMWIFGRDWRAGAGLFGILAGYAPWFMYQHRTIYSFYSVAFEAFLIICVAYILALILGRATDSEHRRRIGAGIVTAYLLVTIAVSAFFYPLSVGKVIPYESWRDRMWFSSWI